MDHKIYCSDCCFLLEPESSGLPRASCPKCGCMNQKIHLSIFEKITVRIGLMMKSKRDGKRPHYESKSIPDHNRDRGKLVHREQVIDRENDAYFERITDYESGEVIHEAKEPLSQHKGHGSDLKNKKF